MLPDRIILLIGLPASGKSTYAADKPTLSSDAIRHLLADDETNQTIHARVFDTLRYLLIQRLEIQRPITYIDATHLTRGERKPYIELAQQHNAEIDAVYFDVPLETCLERNRSRTRKVPEDVLTKMSAKLQPPTEDEGFSQILRIP